MRIVVTGSRGQLGSELHQALGTDHEVISLDRPVDDVTSLRIIAAVEECQPDVVIHCAAMTNVDGCTRDPTAAYLVNALGTRNVALGCQRAGAEMAYISTNEVFDGTKLSYLEFDEPNPINTYGKSKLAGERFVLSLLNRFYIIRTSWLFGRGNNFVRKIISLADAQGELKVVTDEVSSPTYARDLACAIGRLLKQHVYGVYHRFSAGLDAAASGLSGELLRPGAGDSPQALGGGVGGLPGG